MVHIFKNYKDLYRRAVSDKKRVMLELEDSRSRNDALKKENELLRDKNLEFSTLIHKLRQEKGDLELRRDLLERYYSLDREATEEEKTAMRICVEIYDLKLENWALKKLLSDENKRLIERAGLLAW